MPDGQFQDFLNPRSMLTPGFAGGLTVLINNALAGAFGLPGNYLGYSALAISALFATLVLTAGVPLIQRIVFYVLNTLIIFCVAMGSNSTVRELRNTSATTALMLVAPAYAGSTFTSPGQVLQNVEGITGNPSLSDTQKLDQIQQQLQDAHSQGVVRPGGSGFFRNWGF
jgi:choline-glycine betaine transporter